MKVQIEDKLYIESKEETKDDRKGIYSGSE